MENQHNRTPEWKQKLQAFVNSKSFLPSVVGVIAAIIALVACVALFVSGSSEKKPPVAQSQSGSESWPAPADDSNYDASEGKLDVEHLAGTILPETKDAGQKYLDETLFLGDSNTQRYMVYGPDDKSDKHFTTFNNNIGVVSMGVHQITSLKCEQFVGYSEEVTMPQAVKILQPRRIIIGFGTNNLLSDTSSFIKEYKKGLKAIHDAYPYADIIVNAIPPLDKERSNTRLSMKDVDRLNAAIANMCEEEGYKYLDSSKALEDPKTGWAKKDYTISDGVHLSQKGVRAFFEYARTHAYITEDTRPKPLKKIPKVKGVTPNLITNDPIADRSAKVPVEILATEGGRIEGKTVQKVKKGQQTTMVKAVPDEGWRFARWEATIGHVDQQEEIMFTVPGNADANGVVLTAVFEKIPLECICKEWCDPEDDMTWNSECPVCRNDPGSCKAPRPTPKPTAAPTPKPTESPELTAEPTAAPTAEPTAAPTPVPVPEVTPAPEVTPVPEEPVAPPEGNAVPPEGDPEEDEEASVNLPNWKDWIPEGGWRK